MKKLVKQFNKVGTAPGTLTNRTQSSNLTTRILLTEFDKSGLIETEIKKITDCNLNLKTDKTVWIQITGVPSSNLLQEIGDYLKIHPLALEDINNIGQRPKFNDFDNLLLVIMSLPSLKNNKINLEQASFIFGENFILSFIEDESSFESIKQMIRKDSSTIRKKDASYLLYTLLDFIIDCAFPLLENIGEKLDKIEHKILFKPSKIIVSDIHLIKKNLIILRQTYWAHREVINQLQRNNERFFSASTKDYFYDCYEHCIQILDLVESFRDITSSMLDVYLSTMSNRLNEVMKVLTIIATIFIPLTFITGIYGMNFSSASDSPYAMPELTFYYGYPLVWGIMIFLGFAMIIYFKKKNWF